MRKENAMSKIGDWLKKQFSPELVKCDQKDCDWVGKKRESYAHWQGEHYRVTTYKCEGCTTTYYDYFDLNRDVAFDHEDYGVCKNCIEKDEELKARRQRYKELALQGLATHLNASDIPGEVQRIVDSMIDHDQRKEKTHE